MKPTNLNDCLEPEIGILEFDTLFYSTTTNNWIK